MPAGASGVGESVAHLSGLVVGQVVQHDVYIDLIGQSVEDSTMAFNRRCEALLEAVVGSTVLDVAINGDPCGLGHAYPLRAPLGLARELSVEVGV